MNLLLTRARKLAAILAVPAWLAALLRYRVAAGVEHAGALRNLRWVRTVVDIGSNRGQFALVARRYFPQSRIVSFEPLCEPAALWRRVFAGDRLARLVEAAIGPVAGEALIHVSARDDSSSLLPITQRQSALFPGTQEAGTSSIRVIRLSHELSASEIEAPALLKLDVQGFELQALAGCEDLLPQFAWVYVECSFLEFYAGQAFAGEVIAWLRYRSFDLRGVYNVAYDAEGRALQADFLFERNSERSAVSLP